MLLKRSSRPTAKVRAPSVGAVPWRQDSIKASAVFLSTSSADGSLGRVRALSSACFSLGSSPTLRISVKTDLVFAFKFHSLY